MTTQTIETVLDMIRPMIERVTDDIGHDHAWSTSVEEIPHRAVSGFIPYTDGGWNGCVTFGLHSEPSQHTKDIAPILEADETDMARVFCEENALPEGFNPWSLEYPSDLCNEWEQFCMDWECSDDAAWFVYVRAILYTTGNTRNESGTDEILFCLAVNDDLNYGRDHVGAWAGKCGSQWKWERNVPLSEITPELLKEVREQFLTAWAEA